MDIIPETIDQNAPVSANADIDEIVMQEPEEVDDALKTVTEASRPFIPAREPKVNIHQSTATFEPLTEKDDRNVNLPLPAESNDRIQAVIDNLPNIRVDTTPQGKEWVDSLRNGQYIAMEDNVLGACLDRKDSEWHQAMKYTHPTTNVDTPLNLGNVKPLPNSDNNLVGEKAALHVRYLLGGGSLVQIPLWHSGFWMTLKAPTEGKMLELNRRIIDEKISLGRESHGLVFSNMVVFIAEHVLNLAFEHIYQTTYKGWEDTSVLRKRISVLDLPIIAWGLACAIWPRGFQYSRAVLDPGGEAFQTVREKLNITRLLWTDRSSLNDQQLQHMTQRNTGKCMTDTMLDNYRDHFTRGKSTTVPLSKEISMTLRVPSVDQYLQSGTNWINNIVSMVDRSFGMDNDMDRRDAYIDEQGKAANMRQFAHWVESFNLADDRVINDAATIDMICDQLSAFPEIRANYDKAIKAFIQDATISLVATPIVHNSEHALTLPNHPNLLPLDTLSTFFILLVQKSAAIQARP